MFAYRRRHPSKVSDLLQLRVNNNIREIIAIHLHTIKKGTKKKEKKRVSHAFKGVISTIRILRFPLLIFIPEDSEDISHFFFIVYQHDLYITKENEMEKANSFWERQNVMPVLQDSHTEL